MANLQREASYRSAAFHADGGISGIIGLVGQPGCGKTYRLGKLIEKCRRVVVFNSVCSFLPHQAERKNKLTGFQWANDIPTFVRLILAGQRRGSFRIVFTPLDGAEDDAFHHVARLVWRAKNVVFGVDEVWLFNSYFRKPKSFLKRMALTGRHPGVNLVWTAQRPPEVHATLRAQTNEFYLGRVGSILDMHHYRGQVADEAIERLPSLPSRTFIYRDPAMNWRVFK